MPDLLITLFLLPSDVPIVSSSRRIFFFFYCFVTYIFPLLGNSSDNFFFHFYGIEYENKILKIKFVTLPPVQEV